MPKRIALGLLNAIWYSTALLIVLAAMLVAIGREMMPRINLDSDRLTQYLGQRLHADIAVQNLHGQWTRLLPEFSADRVTIHTAELDLTLNKLHLDVDIARSLLQRSPVFDRLEIGSAQVQYKQAENAKTQAVDVEKSWRLVYRLLSNNIRIQNIDFALQQSQQTHLLHLQDFRVEQRMFSKRVFMRLLDANDATTSVTGTISGDTLGSSSGNLYLQLQQWPLRQWLPQQSENTHWQHWLDAGWRARGELWLHWQGLDKADAVARLELTPQVKDPTDSTLPAGLAAAVSGRWQRGGETDITLEKLQLLQTDTALLQDVRVQAQDRQRWRLRTPALALDNMASLPALLPESLLKNLLAQLHPAGTLRNVDLQWDNSKPLTERMQLRANADTLATGAWRGVPAFTGVSGYLQSGIGYGFIDLESHDSFSMFYPQIYREPLQFRQASSRVQWQWQPEQHAVLVGSDNTKLSGEYGDARGSFWLRLPLVANAFPGEMYLAIGLRNSHADVREKLLPYTLPESLQNWLHNSIGNANITDAGFIYRGALSGHEAFSRSIQFYANLDHGEVKFHPDWPKLTALKGKVLVDDGDVRVHADSGKLYESIIDGAMVQVSQQNPGMAVLINARAHGSTEDGLRILRETPLQKTLGNTFIDWHSPQGQLNTALQLQIPLSGANLPATEDVRLTLADTQLQLQGLRLQFEGLQGDLRYESASGLNANALQSRLFKQPLTLAIRSEKSNKGLAIDVHGSGTAAVADIAQWSRLRPLQMLAGDFDYQAQLALGPFGNTAHDLIGKLQIDADMTRSALSLPAPLGKKAGDKAPLALTVNLYRNNRQDYTLNYNQQLNGTLSLRNGELFSGDIGVLAPGTPLQAGPLRIHGTLPDADLQQWLDVVSAYNRLPEADPTAPVLYPQIDFTVGNVRWRDLVFPSVTLNISHPQDAWAIQFDSSNARGQFNLYDNAGNTLQRMPELNLGELRIHHEKSVESAETFGTETGAAGNINFADVLSMNIRIDHFIYNDMDIGRLETQMRSSPSALQFGNLQMTGPGYAVRGKDENPDAELIWRRNADGLYQSEFHGMLHMQGDQPALKHIGADPFVRGENIYLAADLAWTGSPLDFAMPALVGRVQTHGVNGKYLQASPNAAMQAISVVNIANWARRLRLDFSDLTSDGISFDKYEGELTFSNGDMRFSKPLTVEGPSSSMVLSGISHLNSGELDLSLTATLPVSSNATWITALAGGLPAAAGVYLVSKIFGNQIENITSLTYSITGPSADPAIRFERIAAPRKAANP